MAIIESDAAFTHGGGDVDSVVRNFTLLPGGRSNILAGARDLLLATLDQSAAWYSEAAVDLNKYRDEEQKVAVVPEDELPDRAVERLTDDRLSATVAENGLYRTDDDPLILLAVPNTPISRQETIRTWAAARGGNILSWGGSIAFLSHWSANDLSGYDPNNTHDPVRFVVIETAYERNRRGYRDSQLYQLGCVQADHPLIGPASMYEGAVLAKRCDDVSFTAWERTTIRPIGLKPNQDNCIPVAFLNHKGQAVIDESDWGYTGTSRRRIG